ncbi:MAG: response regulator transcription factor [Clostridia bacterium]|nr:response regulator transcription factor [Clostridia bacterium]
MRIALCDDEPQETEQLSRMIEDYALKRNYDIRCDRFAEGRALLREDRYDLYFLDFRMDEMDGIAVAKALKEKFGNAVTICYLTSYDAAAAQIINQGIHADGFLKKPADREELEEKLDRFYRTSYFDRFELRKGKSFRTLYAQDIIYIEANDKQVLIHTWDDTESYNYLMSEIEKLLPKKLFFRIQRSFIVNL